MIPLSAMTSLWATVLPLAEKVPEPDDVKAGWLGFGVFLVLVAAVVLLWFSFRKQLRKVDFEERNVEKASGANGAGEAGGGERSEGANGPVDGGDDSPR